ncbi:hypothetical protein C0J52_09954 [Blattella germanica]|nr:hypothetical protein C0J52_09954 [Blattella germanica]
MTGTGTYGVITILLLLSVTWCKDQTTTTTTATTNGMKLIEKENHIMLKTDEDVIKRPVKCYKKAYLLSTVVFLVNTTKVNEDYLLRNITKGYYWCEDKHGHKSNALIKQSKFEDGIESFINNMSKVLHSHLDTSTQPATTTKDPESNEMPWHLREVPKCPQQITIDSNGHQLEWPPIYLDEYFIHVNSMLNCLDMRKCIYNQRQELVLVELESSNCSKVQRQINVTQAANDLQKLSRKANISANDVMYATSVVNKALKANRSELHAARRDASSLIRSLDSILTRVMLQPGESLNFTQPEVSVFVMSIEQQSPLSIGLSNVSGDLANSSILKLNTQHPLTDDIDIAIILPEMSNTTNHHLAVSFFNDDGAFRDENRTTNSRIVSVTIGSVNSIDILFKPFTNSSNKKCAFWDFSQSDGMWSSEGCELVPSPSKLHDMCHCTHLTHFAEIILPSGSAEPDLILDVISLVGCSLSLLGLVGIFLTGALFWQWRAQLSNKILLHLSAAVALNMLVFLIAATGLLPNMCVPLGALLHYSILTSFCWMLVCAGLQFMRLVSILGTHYTSHLLLKASIFAWGAPLIPVSSLLIVNVELYTSNGKGLCYPGGLAFYLAVLCPVAVIVAINLIVFGTILQRLCESSTIQRHVHSERKLALRRIMTSLLLFFLLGLTWIFGLLAGLNKVFAYLFCITATLQGVVLFLFFVLGEKKSRKHWTAKTTYKSSTQKQSSTNTTSREWL